MSSPQDEYPINRASAILDYVAKRAATVEGLRQSLGRIAVAEEGDTSIHRRFYVDSLGTTPAVRSWGAGVHASRLEVSVEVGFRVDGGATRGSKDVIARLAADTCQSVADVVEDPTANYDRQVTGIRTIEYKGAQALVRNAQREVWSVRFSIVWESACIRTHGEPVP